MRFVLTALLFVCLASAGCDAFRHSEVKVTFLNSTDSLLCFDLSSPADTTFCDEVKPRGKTTWRPGCGYGAPDEVFDLTVVLTVASDRREIYSRTANCKVWNDAHATVIIKQVGDQFVVADSLPGTPSP